MLDFLIYLVIAVLSAGVVINIGETIPLGSQLKRDVAGVSTSLVGTGILYNYTNAISFIEASAYGYLGWQGYLFILSLMLLSFVWISNLIRYKQTIV